MLGVLTEPPIKFSSFVCRHVSANFVLIFSPRKNKIRRPAAFKMNNLRGIGAVFRQTPYLTARIFGALAALHRANLRGVGLWIDWHPTPIYVECPRPPLRHVRSDGFFGQRFAGEDDGFEGGF